jgi:hypothetical protein
MASTSDYVSVTDTAKLLRGALKAAFPKVTFSVRSSKYAGGASIDVGWTDGPTEAQVKAVTELYRGATFDGMQDLKEYHSTLLGAPDGSVREVHFGADFIFTNRTASPELTGSGSRARRRARRGSRPATSTPAIGSGSHR